MPARDAVANATVADAIIDEAAEWLTRLNDGALDADGERALTAWCRRSPEHQRVWLAAQRLTLAFESVPADVGLPVLQRQHQRITRRSVVKSLALLVAAAPATWIAVEKLPTWRAALRTGVGERRNVLLADGSALTLNTDSAVDVHIDARTRVIHLHAGEIFVQTANAGSSLQVMTAQGFVQTAHGSFSLRLDNDASIVQVVDADVIVAPRKAPQPYNARAGAQLRFTDVAWRDEGGAGAAMDATAWLRGELIANDMRLDAFIAELSRYRPGVLRCDPAVADRRISGVFQLDDTDRVLAILRQTLAIGVQYRTPYWVTVTAA